MRSSWQSFCQLLLQVQRKTQLDVLMEESGCYERDFTSSSASLFQSFVIFWSAEVLPYVHLMFPCCNLSLLLLVLSFISCLWVWQIVCPHSFSNSLSCLCSYAKSSLCLLSYVAKLLIFPWIPPPLRTLEYVLSSISFPFLFNYD